VFQISKIALVALLGVGSAQAVQHRLPLEYAPLSYPISSWFDHTPGTGYETRYDGVNIPSYSPYHEAGHKGTDFGAPAGTPVYASAKGTVLQIRRGCLPTGDTGCGGGFGNHIAIKHSDNLISIYAHLSSVPSSMYVGLVVNCVSGPVGTLVGYSGNTGVTQGPHLHYELRANTMDPNVNPSYDPFSGLYGPSYWYDWALITDTLRIGGYTMKYPVTGCQPGQ
jgi:murein DD-endopeptidase MepM/ murein hydrolase activator NlpD